MILPFPCNNIYVRLANKRQLNIVFLHSPSGNAIYYDGWSYAFVSKAAFARETFVESDYSKNHQDEVMMIEAIRTDFDISYVKFKNGDIFQLYYVMDDENNPQRLSVFSPADWSYQNALTRFEETEVATLATSSAEPSVLNWFTSGNK